MSWKLCVELVYGGWVGDFGRYDEEYEGGEYVFDVLVLFKKRGSMCEGFGLVYWDWLWVCWEIWICWGVLEIFYLIVDEVLFLVILFSFIVFLFFYFSLEEEFVWIYLCMWIYSFLYIKELDFLMKDLVDIFGIINYLNFFMFISGRFFFRWSVCEIKLMYGVIRVENWIGFRCFGVLR